ncbi:MAG: DUF3461 family protein [Marinobacterium sp.]|nr:DUF3461 family protein [Marinobacterium sp.]
MSDFPTLTQMGVTSLESVVRYTLRQEGDTDVLKIYYNRPGNSMRSRSKKFSFVRDLEGSNSDQISPMLQAAIDELKQLQASHDIEPGDAKEHLRTSLEHLEKVLTTKLDDVRRQIEQLR